MGLAPLGFNKCLIDCERRKKNKQTPRNLRLHHLAVLAIRLHLVLSTGLLFARSSCISCLFC
jgi:hypothetical protein